MFDSQNFQSLFRDSVEDEIVLKIINAPRPNATKVFPFEAPQSADEWILAKLFNRPVNRLKERDAAWGLFSLMRWK